MSDGSDSGIPTPIEYIGCQELLEKSCSHFGWVRKRHSILNNSVTQKLFNWPQVYVVLSEGCFYYFKNEKAKSASGQFSLYGYNSVLRASEISHKDAPWAFKLVHTHREFKSYFFSASCEKDMKKWMQSVKAEMLRANSKNFSSYYMYGRNVTKPDKSDTELNNDKFYEDIEVNIYEDIGKCKLPKNYSKHCSVKRDDEESDDDSIDNDLVAQYNARIEDRPPMPLPDNCNYTNIDTRAPVPLPRPPDLEPPPSLQYKSIHKVKTESDTNGQGEVTEDKPPLPGRKRGKNKDIEPIVIVQQIETVEIPATNEEKEETLSSTDYWSAIYFNDGTGDEASQIITSIAEDGVYLVRPNTQGEGQVLVVYSLTETKTKKFRIKKENGRYFLQKDGPSEKTVEALLNQYYDIFLPTIDLKLTLPYKLHEKYKELIKK
ncbi:hypothetical protein CHS0354_016646 [Potamilus streckersoni]|uniref:Uncharacterized protein n=1 Tax=Potamilus streckersoni TaxID=2493646 RepID=A0AAE0TI77_9BIVA|nr:hypothetical protein CHS0354_016646 [Potamilus streckersoni]